MSETNHLSTSKATAMTSSKQQFGNAVASILILILALVAVAGWVLNIVKLVALLNGEITAMFVARLIGVFAFPLGAIIGHF
jgi:flagellar biogenesis protein FliO